MTCFPMEEHPVLEALLECGCGVLEAWTALLVYLDLAEVRSWASCQVTYSPRLKAPLIRGQPALSQPPSLVVPITDSRPVPSYVSALAAEAQDCSVMLGIVGSSGAVVYHALDKGLVPPDPPELIAEHRAQRMESKAKRFGFTF